MTIIPPDLRRDRIIKAYEKLEAMLSEAINELGVNYYEMAVVFQMMDANIKAQNIASYIQVEVTKLDRELNKKVGFTKREELK